MVELLIEWCWKISGCRRPGTAAGIEQRLRDRGQVGWDYDRHGQLPWTLNIFMIMNFCLTFLS
jgi:hypothetical protein